MSNRLSVWILTAAAISIALPIAVLVSLGAGLNGFLAMWVVPIGLTPGVLATLLTIRAIVCALRGASPDLVLNGSRIDALTGRRAWLLPASVLLAWLALRESGVLSVTCYSSSSATERTSTSTPSQPTAGDAALTALDLGQQTDVLHEAFRRQVEQVASNGFSVAGRVEFVMEAPFAIWPLWKSTANPYQVTAHLILRNSTAPMSIVGVLDVAVECKGRWQMLGVASQRNFRTWLGDSAGAATRAFIEKELQKLAKKPG